MNFLLTISTLIFTLPCLLSHSVKQKARVTVSRSRNTADTLALAELRFYEWMVTAGEESENNSNHIQNHDDNHHLQQRIDVQPPLPSIHAFRMATMDIQKEREKEGAITFLARIGTDVVGSAELSPIEFQKGAIVTTTTTTNNREDGKTIIFPSYVTDVVTAKSHRRKGVGDALMEAIEQEAINQGISHICLHVARDNAGALKFYQTSKLGYAEPSSTLLQNIDTNKLEENAGATGQILLCKQLSSLTLPERGNNSIVRNKKAEQEIDAVMKAYDAALAAAINPTVATITARESNQLQEEKFGGWKYY